MKKLALRPQRLDVQDVDLAVQEALQRIAQANELSEEECQRINGGLGSATAGRISPEDPIG